KCYARVTVIGSNTLLGKLGKSLATISTSKTLLQHQIGHFVKIMAIVGLLFFTLIWLLNYLHSYEILESLLIALTLAMAIVPEEIPVAFSSFMALGAYHMARLGIITRNPLTIENLGEVSVICLDKTGTITENKMQVKILYDEEQNNLEELKKDYPLKNKRILYLAWLASEAEPFDAMEKAIVEAYGSYGDADGARPEIVHEYPLSGQPPMMTHVYRKTGGLLAVAKGAPERILQVCHMNESISEKILTLVRELGGKGYRILGVCYAIPKDEDYPERQDDFEWSFKGVVALYDPPKIGVNKEFEVWYRAGISIKLVTGDYKETAINIARQVGMKIEGAAVSGEEILQFSESELQRIVHHHNIFARMFPEAKLKLVEALKSSGEIVAMMGDGVNDGPALKSAHIGIAMGRKGTEIARQAADLILTDDHLGKVTEAIQQGRKIYHNLKKAIRYIISIHVPIILTASLPLMLGWIYPNIFTPIHVIFLELIMGPTCSIFYEREPVEQGLMSHAPRKHSYAMFSVHEAFLSVLQGLIISLGVLGIYYVFMKHGYSLSNVRTLVFLTIITSNIFLTFTNRSFEQSIGTTLKYKNELAKYVLFLSLGFLSAVTLIPTVRTLFLLSPISLIHFSLCIGVSFLVTFWLEAYKVIVRKKNVAYKLTLPS
ncbi:MAG: cation-translocating P-type ATPase, partial [Flavisolibacter sp.]